ncbi:hypothetical protein PAXRUDRAFT_543385 [Paxillus rubicundulus Ve08.2h10]|uniref:Uncharacterized protein n=1 Tax=Paxillus rubicundulus Ve08.2h10 TaxID=930991 RepID=A0A0D0D7Y4_9AGAM|nr:hypothetical protein PAXRUDRAFT_543385 [Paxillus rubicundulus Ve08.2h10]
MIATRNKQRPRRSADSMTNQLTMVTTSRWQMGRAPAVVTCYRSSGWLKVTDGLVDIPKTFLLSWLADIVTDTREVLQRRMNARRAVQCETIFTLQLDHPFRRNTGVKSRDDLSPFGAQSQIFIIALSYIYVPLTAPRWPGHNPLLRYGEIPLSLRRPTCAT